MIRGEPGAGKTALLEDTVERAPDMQVLMARGIESEAELPFAALHQLLWPALDHVDVLPAPQARALRGALGLADEATVERFLAFSACLTLLSELAERRPVLCIIDDAHWLDSASADAIRFVARRLGGEGIVILFGVREGDERTFDAGDLPALMLGGLDAQAADALLSDVANVNTAVRAQLVGLAQGNPLAIVELPQALTVEQLEGTAPLPEALPMTRQLEAAFHARVARLPEHTRRVLLLAAADGSEELGVVSLGAAELGLDTYALDAAERDGLVVVSGNRVLFRHPLVRSAIYGTATSSERRAAHRALASALAVDDAYVDRRAWHLAASAIEHDEAVVAELDQAALRAEARGGFVAAARALERAAELSQDPVEASGRLVRAARGMSIAGQDDLALALADRAAPVNSSVLRAEVAEVRATAAVRRGRPASGVPGLIDSAREIAPSDPARAVDLVRQAMVAGWQGDGAASQLQIAATLPVLSSMELSGAPRFIAESIQAFAALIKGDAAHGIPVLRETIDWAYQADDAEHVIWGAWAAIWIGDAKAFEALLDRGAMISRERGQIAVLAEILGIRAVHLALFAQRPAEASVAATEAAELGNELGAGNILVMPWIALAIVAAIHGRDNEARELAERVLEHARVHEVRIRTSPAVVAIAYCEMNRGRWDEAYRHLASLTDGADPVVGVTAADKVEVAVRAGLNVEAREALTFYEAWAEYARPGAPHPRLESCRAIVAGGDAATRHFEEAVRLIEAARPFNRPRILLLYGEHLRREGQRVEAREHLRAAIEGFEALGAEPWAERARTELRASGETARKRSPGAVVGLTPQELQIARLVAQGLTNKEVAAQLFLSPRTIDAHLRGVFAKLGITSRRALRGIPLDGPMAPLVGAPEA